MRLIVIAVADETPEAEIEAFVEKVFSTQDLWGGDLT